MSEAYQALQHLCLLFSMSVLQVPGLGLPPPILEKAVFFFFPATLTLGGSVLGGPFLILCELLAL